MKKTYYDKVHTWGRIWSITALLVLFSVPLSISVKYNAWPEMTNLFSALLKVLPIFWISAVVEVITYTPMLGAGGTYLSFVTGNITNLKLPCGVNAMKSANVKANSEEGEVISTIAIATCSIVTTLILVIGVCALTVIAPILDSPVLVPAFDNILPALFGGLAVVYVSKNWKLAMAPLIFMVILFLAVPSLASSVGVLVPVGVLIALGVARILYNKGWV